MDYDVPQTRQSSIVVAVRVRPFTAQEQAHLIIDQSGAFGKLQLGDASLVLPGAENSTPTKTAGSTGSAGSTETSGTSGTGNGRFKPQGLRQIVDCVDDKMLIFDPAEHNPLRKISDTVLNAIAAPAGSRRSGEHKFVFDRVFRMDASQLEVYEATTRPLLDAVLDGFHGTVFAYGATGCGKTYTVSGPAQNPGIIFLTMQELFGKIDQMRDTKRFELTASYLEIYNESIRDLLEPETSSKKLVLREDSHRHISVANLSHHPLKTVEDVMDLVVRGNSNRTTSATDANETSSRSHAVLQIHITQRNRTAELKEDQKFATLSLIDLAGSERASATKNRGERLHEGANINRSLLALGNCINALCVNGKRGSSCHVPYRDSKLTRLLKFSLGGNCKTVMIVCISPGSNHYDESLNTLKYATRAKEIKTKLIRNRHSLDRHVGSYLKMITEQRQEIEELRSRERKIIDLQISKHKISRERIHMAVWDSIQALRGNYRNSEKFQHLKMIKSLILCKRRFLQMVGVELATLLNFVDVGSQLQIDCSALCEQLTDKVKDLEQSFDTPDELDLSLEHTREVDLLKLQEMENWHEETDLIWYDSLLSSVAESVRNEILVFSSVIMERFMENSVLVDRVKFVSQTLLRSITDNNLDGHIDSLALLEELHQQMRSLIHIDEEFEAFAASVHSNVTSSASTNTEVASHWSRDWNVRKLSTTQAHRRYTTSKISKSNSGTPSPVQRSRHSQGGKTAKKVRWSELVPGNDSISMMLDDENPNQNQDQNQNQASSTTVWPTFEEDVSMQDLRDAGMASQTGTAAVSEARDTPSNRKMSLTATALIRGK
ncbi:LAME_0H19834g1_1 [Lachancea meyersii CBS 8951]|uniref:Kinesin-like protein n=1 Tax=Lachancea meyersii CBS 8951 TaxID=1266667 RepID=A0A1G4KJH9_9SACH|nr:LAME_0H19834g1_1 [Lachancea meyersii CBS 8951]